MPEANLLELVRKRSAEVEGNPADAPVDEVNGGRPALQPRSFHPRLPGRTTVSCLNQPTIQLSGEGAEGSQRNEFVELAAWGLLRDVRDRRAIRWHIPTRASS